MNSPFEVFSPSKENIHRNNLWFIFVVAAGLGILGSVITTMVAISAITILIFQTQGKIRRSEDPGIWNIAQFFLFFYIATAIGAIVHFGHGENLGFLINRLPFLAFFPIAMALSYSERNQLREFLELGAAIGSVLSVSYAAYELSIGVGRAEGADGNSGSFALSMALAFTFCLFGILRSKTRARTLLMLLGTVSAVLCIVASGTRSMWPLILVLPLIAIWGHKAEGLGSRWKYYLFGAGITLSLVILYLGDRVLNRLMSISRYLNQIFVDGHFNNTLGERLIMWDYAWQTFRENIVFGVGNAELKHGLSQFAKSEYGIQFPPYSHLHNIFADAAVRGGLIELIATIALLVGPLLLAWKKGRNGMSRYGLAMMVAIAVIFLSSGMLNKAFGHDIHDTLFTYFMAVATWFVFGENKITTGLSKSTRH